MRLNRSSFRTIRECKGKTLSGLAIATGVQQGHMSNIEHGRRRASDELIVALAGALDVPLQAIVLDDLGIPNGEF